MTYLLKSTFACFIVISVMASCHQEPKKQQQRAPKKAALNYSGPYDIARLQLKENVKLLMAQQGIKPEKSATSRETFWGLEAFESSAPKALRFGGVDLSGGTDTLKNRVNFHYREGNDSLALYEVNIFNKPQTQILVAQLKKLFGKPIFERIGHKKGTLSIDLEGNAVPWKPGDNYTYRVWEDKRTGITYFLSSMGFNEQITTQLTALRRSDKFGKDQISVQGLDWYERD